MRIASYNLWNSDMGMPAREESIREQIIRTNADILCLQEVKNQAYLQALATETDYPHFCFFNHTYEQEGLAVLSKYPIKTHHYILRSVYALIECPERNIALVNVHLDWESILKREKEIIEATKFLQYMKADYYFLAGDFNCSPESGVHRFMLGHQSLMNMEATPHWYDLAESYAEKTGTAPEKTLDIRNNPRWEDKNTVEISQRYDRILLMNPYPQEFPSLVRFGTFGQTTDKATGLAPSDHWGVYADVEF